MKRRAFLNEFLGALALGAVEPGAAIDVYLGTWCSDSERELARFWRALDLNLGIVPFDVRYIAVDRSEEFYAVVVRQALRATLVTGVDGEGIQTYLRLADELAVEVAVRLGGVG